MITAAALCPAPPLLARELTGPDPVLPELRQACRAAAAGLLDAAPEVIIVVGAAAGTRTWDAAARLDLAAFAPVLRRAGPGGLGGPGEPGGSGRLPSLPVPLGLGARLLDEVGYAGPRALQSVGHDEPAARCAELGARLARGPRRAALLVMADGTARRDPRAPGCWDQPCAALDAQVDRAVRGGRLSTLLGLDQEQARILMATGRPGWQVLAGALGDAARARAHYSGDPFGVAYLVASLQPPAAAGGATGPDQAS